jgi:L-2-hydroxyglutarate oxidase LhgO
MTTNYDYLIVGAGIIGMTIANELISRNENLKIAIIEKEDDVAKHASGRNSGVLHAGFYYTADSLKARFTVDGNKRMKTFCQQHKITVNETTKVVVVKNEEELKNLYLLEQRGKVNGVDVKIIDEKQLAQIDPNIKTFQKALYSPTTASVDPKLVCCTLRDSLKDKGVIFYFNTNFKNNNFKASYTINCAGSYADKVARHIGLIHNYTMLPFKGIYLKYMSDKTAIKTNIYPVPNLANPFLGVHYTVTYDGSIKIGPTAIPAFWRENYKGFENFNPLEMLEIIFIQIKLLITNAFNFRNLALQEMKNYNKSFFINQAKKMVYSIKDNFEALPAGIRAQLLNTKTNELVQDFIVEHTNHSTHVLNAVSPAFTCSFAFAEYVVDQIIENKQKVDR